MKRAFTFGFRLIGCLMALVATRAGAQAPSGASAAVSTTADTSATAAGTTQKKNFGHYFATSYSDTPAEAAALCERAGVTGVVWRSTWHEVEPRPGVYNFGSFDKVLHAIVASRKPSCHLWLMVEFKSFVNSPVKNPCPTYLQARHSAPNSYGRGAATCFLWEPVVTSAYVQMVKAAAARYDRNPRVEGLVIQESSLALNGRYSQDVRDGGTYTPGAWRNALIQVIDHCSAAFAHSHCMAFLNFLRGGQSYLHDVSAAISSVPGNRACISGPDLLPNNPALYEGNDASYQVIVRHSGCRAISAQNHSYHVQSCGLECLFGFAVGGTFGAFPARAPLTGGLCVNSYLFWNDKFSRKASAQDWTDALGVIAKHPYGPGWLGQCAGNDGKP